MSGIPPAAQPTCSGENGWISAGLLRNYVIEGEMKSRPPPPALKPPQCPQLEADPRRPWLTLPARPRTPSSPADQFAAAPEDRFPGKRKAIRSRWYFAN